MGLIGLLRYVLLHETDLNYSSAEECFDGGAIESGGGRAHKAGHVIWEVTGSKIVSQKATYIQQQ